MEWVSLREFCDDDEDDGKIDNVVVLRMLKLKMMNEGAMMIVVEVWGKGYCKRMLDHLHRSLRLNLDSEFVEVKDRAYSSRIGPTTRPHS